MAAIDAGAAAGKGREPAIGAWGGRVKFLISRFLTLLSRGTCVRAEKACDSLVCACNVRRQGGRS